MKPDYKILAEIVRNRVSCADVARDFGMKISRDGRSRCVFCDGARDDTLRLYSGSKGFYCFRCHKSGDVISLYQQITGAGFRDAVEQLDQQYGIGLPLDGVNEEALRKAREISERRKREREEHLLRERKLFEEYLNAADAVYVMEQNRKNTAPETREELWKQRFVIALRYLDEMRDYRDRIFDELMSIKRF